MITEEIPAKVAADKAYQNAIRNSDKENAKVEHGKALERVMTAVLNDDTQLFSKFQDDADFRRWLTQTVFAMTYKKSAAEAEGVAAQ
jgi:type I restriction enzyme R subunit